MKSCDNCQSRHFKQFREKLNNHPPVYHWKAIWICRKSARPLPKENSCEEWSA